MCLQKATIREELDGVEARTRDVSSQVLALRARLEELYAQVGTFGNLGWHAWMEGGGRMKGRTCAICDMHAPLHLPSNGQCNIIHALNALSQLYDV
jgi:hypothetical protein